jgi:hypothetical protein
MVIRGTLVQIDTPDEMLGRVNAVNSIFINTSNQLGEFESGMLAAWLVQSRQPHLVALVRCLLLPFG